MLKLPDNPGSRLLASERYASFARKIFSLVILCATSAPAAHAQLIGEPNIPRNEKRTKKDSKHAADLEWMYQYSPPPAEGRENDLIQDPHFRPFLDKYFTAPQSFWGPNPTDPKAPTHKSLADTAYDFLAIPDRVVFDQKRYVTATGAVRRFPTSRGLIFADLNNGEPLVVFAAIDWIRESRPVADPDAEYTLWIFPNKPLADRPAGQPQSSTGLPQQLLNSLTRWMLQPLARNGNVQKITAAILVDPEGTPHQIPVPTAEAAPAEAQPLPKRR